MPFDTHLLLSTVALGLGTAITPVMLLNVSTLVAARHFHAWRGFLIGAAIVTALLAAAVLGLLGTFFQDQSAEIFASRTLDLVLGLGLLAYGGFGLTTSIQRRREEKRLFAAVARAEGSAAAAIAVAAAPTVSGRSQTWQGVVAGTLGMATNFSSIIIFVAAMQRLSTSEAPRWERLALVAVVCLCMLLPVILPRLLALGAGGVLERMRDGIERPAKRFGPRLSASAALLFGVLLVLRALTR